MTREEICAHCGDGMACSDEAQEECELLNAFKTLADWKESMLEVESKWEPEKVARELNIPLGLDIRENILPKIKALREKLGAENREKVSWFRIGQRRGEERNILREKVERLEEREGNLIGRLARADRMDKAVALLLACEVKDNPHALEDLRKAHAAYREGGPLLIAEWPKDIEKAIRQLEAAKKLVSFARHKLPCPFVTLLEEHKGDVYKCTCGLDELKAVFEEGKGHGGTRT